MLTLLRGLHQNSLMRQDPPKYFLHSIIADRSLRIAALSRVCVERLMVGQTCNAKVVMGFPKKNRATGSDNIDRSWRLATGSDGNSRLWDTGQWIKRKMEAWRVRLRID